MTAALHNDVATVASGPCCGWRDARPPAFKKVARRLGRAAFRHRRTRCGAARLLSILLRHRRVVRVGPLRSRPRGPMGQAADLAPRCGFAASGDPVESGERHRSGDHRERRLVKERLGSGDENERLAVPSCHGMAVC